MPVNYAIDNSSVVEPTNLVISLIPRGAELWYSSWQNVQVPALARDLSRASIFGDTEDYLVLSASSFQTNRAINFNYVKGSDTFVFSTSYNTKRNISLFLYEDEIPFEFDPQDIIVEGVIVSKAFIKASVYLADSELSSLRLRIQGIHRAHIKLGDSDAFWLEWYRPVKSFIQNDQIARTGSALTLYESPIMGLFLVERREVKTTKNYDVLINRGITGEKTTWKAYTIIDHKPLTARDNNNWQSIIGDFDSFTDSPKFTRKDYASAL